MENSTNQADIQTVNSEVMDKSAVQLDNPIIKMALIGDIGTGKTAFVKRFRYDNFSPQYKSTFGVDFALKTHFMDKMNTDYRIQMWDIAGQERFGNLIRIYLKESL